MIMKYLDGNIEITLTNPRLCTSGFGVVSNRFNLEFWKKSLLEFSLENSSAVELSLVSEGRALTKGLALLFWAALAWSQLNLLIVSGLGDGVGVSSGVSDEVGVSGGTGVSADILDELQKQLFKYSGCAPRLFM